VTKTIALLSATTVLIVSCTSETTVPALGQVPHGTWGADNAALIVDDNAAHLHIGCTNGYFPTPVRLDAKARFVTSGSYILRAYPVMVGPPLPAEFTGSVDGNRLTVSVVVNDTVEKKVVNLGPVTVQLGVEPRMGPCPVCLTADPRMLVSMRAKK
jgi:hypothetical protein